MPLSLHATLHIRHAYHHSVDPASFNFTAQFIQREHEGSFPA
jgi:hypothetical protein